MFIEIIDRPRDCIFIECVFSASQNSKKPLKAVWSPPLFEWHSFFFYLFSFFKIHLATWLKNTLGNSTGRDWRCPWCWNPPAGIPKRRAAQRCSCPWCWKPTCTRTALSNQPVLRRVRINQCVRSIGGEERCENTPGTWRPVTAMIRLSKWLMSDRWASESGRWAHRILMIMLSGRFFFFFLFIWASSKSNGGVFWLI